MTESPVKPPTTVWGLFTYDPEIREKRIVALYFNIDDAQLDAMAISNADRQPTIDLFDVQNAPLYSAVEPADEMSADDFDTPIHVEGEVN